MRLRLLLDVMCGGLVSYLRMCGHDAAYALDRGIEDDRDLLELAREEDRTLVTRDVQLAGRAGDAILVESRDVREQLRELVAAGVPLALDERPSVCGRCNGPLERVPADASTPEYAPDPDGEAVWRCSACRQCFWRGSHWDDVRATLEGL
ncbi:Mut7-C RNAse domain-containing protein [Halomarina pelagica]|uniref:Mut7-C RNAse domain-containing protein n=1 Tax=Halomarina pelagica TaxID=2961599 RepID=UPI0020C1D170|nr:Mut7-C RNAse domain-containing protein [Halomarina sp. BND7]